jgi:hypothetical protein
MTETAAHAPATCLAPRPLRALAIALVATVVVLLVQTVAAAPAGALTGVDLATYKRVGRHDLPEPTRTVAPAGSLLAQEASGVTLTGTRTASSSSATAAPQSSRSARAAN